MKPSLLSASALLAALMPAAQAQFKLQQLSSLPANIGGTASGAGEITSFDSSTNRLFVTRSETNVASGVNYFDVSNPSSPQPLGFIDFSNVFGGGASQIFSLTSVAVDPAGRGFGVAAIVPKVNAPGSGDYRTGLIGIFDTSTGAVLQTLDVGYHPDSVTFSPDGTRLLVANEGEYSVLPGVNQRPGSISVLDISGITSANKGTSIAGLTSAQVNTVDFSTANITGLRAPAVSLPGTGGNETMVQAMEPEYISVVGDRAFVSLQDNNAMAELNLSTMTWSSVRSMGTITHSIDAISNSTAMQTHTITGMPMPDNIAAFTSGGKTYIATANEGDARVDGVGPAATNVDEIRVSNLGTTNFPGYDGDTPLDRPALDNLRISRLDGDTDGDGSINVITTFGTRSISIYDADTGDLVWDSGSFLETQIAANDPTHYADGRSGQKGPEPEALTLGEVDGRTLLVAGMERSNHIFLFDITDPTAPIFQDFELAGDTYVRPESINFLSAANSPTGLPMLIVGFEGSGDRATEGLAFFNITTTAPIPEPSAPLLALGGLLAGLSRRKRRKL
ncbi:MAG: choice-of-anchor I family protein [Verrucomicrobiota bacterium]